MKMPRRLGGGGRDGPGYAGDGLNWTSPKAKRRKAERQACDGWISEGPSGWSTLVFEPFGVGAHVNHRHRHCWLWCWGIPRLFAFAPYCKCSAKATAASGHSRPIQSDPVCHLMSAPVWKRPHCSRTRNVAMGQFQTRLGLPIQALIWSR
jgi:hypothetical protein